MNALDAIYQRRAINHFDETHQMSPEEETQLLEATIQAPTM
jgi:hypothetical protein